MAKPKLTIREAKLVKAKAEGKTHDIAHDEAGYSPNTSKEVKVVNTSKVLSKPHVQNALYLALQARGITPDKIIAPVADALEHEDLDMRLKGHDRAVKLTGIGKEDNGTTIIFNQGDLVKSKYVKD